MLDFIKLDIIATLTFICSYLTDIFQVVFLLLSIVSISISIIYKLKKNKK